MSVSRASTWESCEQGHGGSFQGMVIATKNVGILAIVRSDRQWFEQLRTLPTEEPGITNAYRKLIRHDHEPGELPELTFSCDRRMPLLTIDDWRKLLCESIDRAVTTWEFRLVAFVVLPEHVHLLAIR